MATGLRLAGPLLRLCGVRGVRAAAVGSASAVHARLSGAPLAFSKRMCCTPCFARPGPGPRRLLLSLLHPAWPSCFLARTLAPPYLYIDYRYRPLLAASFASPGAAAAGGSGAARRSVCLAPWPGSQEPLSRASRRLAQPPRPQPSCSPPRLPGQQLPLPPQATRRLALSNQILHPLGVYKGEVQSKKKRPAYT